MSNSIGLFDHLKNITQKRYKEYDWLKANGYRGVIYMLNRFISMDPDMIPYANYMNVLAVQDEELHFDFFFALLPKSNKFLKYIGGSKKTKSKNGDLIDLLYDYLQISKTEIEDYISRLDKKQIKELKTSFGGK